MSAIAAPAVNRATVMRHAEHVAVLHGLVPKGRVIHEEYGRRVYAADAFRVYAALPLAVVLPATVREVSQVLKYCYDAGLKVTPRGGGTSLTGGAVASEDGIVLCLSLMARVLEVDFANRCVRVEAGTTIASVSEAVSAKSFCFAPDPASRGVASIGGSIATNAGGARAATYGAIAQSVLALKLVLIDGEVVELGGGELEPSGFNLIGLVAGSEGLLGVVVEATLRVVPMPEARRVLLLGFESVGAALAVAENLQQAGFAPSAVELLDRRVIGVCEEFAPSGLERAAEAVLIVEFEGAAAGIDDLCTTALKAAAANGATGQLDMADGPEADRIRHACDAAFIALARLGAVHCIDVAVPPARFADAVSGIREIADRHGLGVAHMGRPLEGIVRSVWLTRAANADAAMDVSAAMADAARMTAELGGELGGEHGLGAAKRDLLELKLSAVELALHARLKSAFDAEWLMNPGKVYPLD